MEIKLLEVQKESIKILTGAGRNEQELVRQFINVGILFCSSSPSNRKLIMEILEPK